MPRFNDPTTELTYLEKDDVLMAGSPDDFSNIKAQNLFNRSLTRSALQTLITDSELIIGQEYTITNAVGSTLVLVVKACAVNKLDEVAVSATNGENYIYDITTDTATQSENEIPFNITSPTNGQVIIYNSDNEEWNNVLLNYVEPEWFGAVGDGATDDTQAIKDAISFMTTNEIKVLSLKDTYLISGEVALGQNKRIQGGGTLKRIDEVKTTITQSLVVGNLSATVTSSAGFAVGQDVRIYKAGYGDTNYNTNRMVITEIQGNTIYWSGALTQSFASGDFLITACKLLSVSDGCVVDGIDFDGNKANNTSFTRWDVQNECYGTVNTAEYSIINCKFYNSVADTLVLYGNKVTVSNCRFENINGNAVHFSDTDQCIIENCYIENTNLATSAVVGHAGGCISFSDKNKNIIISNNILVNGIYGIGYSSGSTSSANHYNALIQGNTIRDCRTGAMDLRSTTAGVRFDDMTILGNKIYNSGIVDITSSASSVAKRKLVFKDNVIFNGRISISYVEDCEIADNKVLNDVNSPESSLVTDDITNTSILVMASGSKKIIIDRNHVYAGRYGIYVSGSTDTTGQFSIRNNYVFKTYEVGIRVFSTGALYQWAVTGNYVGNETTCLSTWDGIGISANCMIAFNYVFAQGGRSCVFLNNNNGGRVYKNQLYATSTSIYSVTGSGGTSGCDVVDNIINCPIRVGNIPLATNLITGNTYPAVIKRGTATLVGGTITVSLSGIVTENQVFLTKTTAGGTEGHIRVTVTAGSGFTITSSSNLDTSTFTWLIQ
jgi:hypothetical protein